MDLLIVYKLRPPYMKCIQYQQVNPPETPIPDYSNVQLLENITQSVKKDDFSPHNTSKPRNNPFQQNTLLFHLGQQPDTSS